ncbi:hypothetical protein EG68_01133 [Paragonimus skrjabini miyazakii]|uniref:Secreted protein n=1 Tax=Paragonimus skrjabini miyazakii TaxID=59628 RepID=A0A8S9Z2B2_9TREM|nr:hypothetical protein EG68_01133 [Paragonimus skrjabini miyazakii]
MQKAGSQFVLMLCALNRATTVCVLTYRAARKFRFLRSCFEDTSDSNHKAQSNNHRDKMLARLAIHYCICVSPSVNANAGKSLVCAFSKEQIPHEEEQVD